MPELGVHQRTCNINVMEDSKFDVLGQWQPWKQLLPSVCTCHGKNKIQRMMADGQGSYEAWCGPGPVFVSKLLFYHNVYTDGVCVVSGRATCHDSLVAEP